MYYIAGLIIIGVIFRFLIFVFKNLFFNEDGFIWGIINTVWPILFIYWVCNGIIYGF